MPSCTVRGRTTDNVCCHGVVAVTCELLFRSVSTVSELKMLRKSTEKRSRWEAAIRKSFWALTLPPFVLLGMYFGIFTATEAAGVGPMARRLNVQFPVVTDIDSSVAARLNPRRVAPFMILVDRKGKVVREKEGWTAEHIKNLPSELDALVQ